MREALNEPTFGPHALRRSYRSGLSDLGVDADTAELMLGHKRPGLIGVYDKSKVWDQRVAAQNLWEAHIAKITSRKTT